MNDILMLNNVWILCKLIDSLGTKYVMLDQRYDDVKSEVPKLQVPFHKIRGWESICGCLNKKSIECN